MNSILISIAFSITLLLCLAPASYADFNDAGTAQEELDESGFVEKKVTVGHPSEDYGSPNHSDFDHGVNYKYQSGATEYEFAGMQPHNSPAPSSSAQPAAPQYSAPQLPGTSTALTAPKSYSLAPVGRNKGDFCFPRHAPAQAFNGIYNQLQPGSVLPPTSTSTIDIRVADTFSMRDWHIMQAQRLGIAPEVIQYFVDTDDERGLAQHIKAVKAAQDAAKKSASVGPPN